MVHIVYYGMGNVGSIKNMLGRLGVESTITSDPAELETARRLILPGVGHFDRAMEQLESLQLLDVLHEKALVERVPVLGICLGMQLLTRSSEEGERPGLGWIEGETVRFRMTPEHAALRLPHMGWNTIQVSTPNPLVDGLAEGSRFYFVHTYHVRCDDASRVVATATYGQPFPCVIGRDNVMGTQFHPEKSHRFGLRLLENFVRSC